ncbi:MAG: PilN domain-containing protein [Syntrophales bacterium]
MIKINLIPYREKEKKDNLQRQIVIISGAVIIFLLIIIAVHLYLSADLKKLESKEAAAEARLLILDKKVGDVEKFKKKKHDLEQKLAVINTLEANRSFPVRLLDGLNLLVPSKELWLEKVTQKGQEVRIEGMARDNGTVARFMKSLEKTVFISRVDLVVAREKEVAGVKLQQFVITCVVNSKGE